MKKIALATFSLLLANAALPQNKPARKPPTQTEMNKQMAEAMKGMSPGEQAEVKKMMNQIMPALNDKAVSMADYPDFDNNQMLAPKKNVSGIAALSKNKLTQANMGSYAGNLFSKIMSKGDASEIALVKSILAKAPKAIDLGNASVIAMMQGHPQAAMALSIKAVQLDPSNVNAQNNMAALLTQYGYPGQAMPVLEKLKNQFPYNSTVLNNVGQAWFSLGELDSAKNYFAIVNRVNPHHPESKLCGGIIEELKGDPIKAEKEYVEAIENSPNPFIDKIIKNKSGEKGIEKIDFEKIKRSLTIYEYFPKDWIKIPTLSDNVSGYQNDMRIINGYNTMFDLLKAKIETATEASNQEVDILLKKGEDEFIKEMAKANIQGINKMSLTAVTVQKILQLFMAQWMRENAIEYTALKNKIDAKREEMTKGGENDKCPDFDRKNNEFLAYANPLIRKYHAERIEIFRTWLNTFCTWIWYITGNPKNTVMTMCLAWSEGLANLYESAVNEQYAIAKSCVDQNGDGNTFMPVPEIPNFSCPTLVKIPIGKDWQELNSAVKNFDGNSWGIKNNPSNPVPNHTQALGGSRNSIAQPGVAPFVQSAQGQLNPGMINETDDELTPLSKIGETDDLAPLPKIPLDELTPLSKINETDDLAPLPKIPMDELTPLPDLRRAKILKELLNKMMSADCNINKYNYKPPVFEVRIGEITFEEPTKSVTETKTEGDVVYVTYDDGSAAVFMEDGSILEIDAPSKNITETKEDGNTVYVTYDDGSEAVFMEDGSILEIEAPKDPEKTITKKITLKPKSTAPDVASKNNVYTELKDFQKQVETNSLQPSINAGVQVPGTFSLPKNLFQ